MDPKGKQTRVVTIVVSMAVIAALFLARDVLIPFALAALVSFLLSPLVQRLQRRGIPRIVAVAFAMLLMVSSVGALGWIVVSNARDLANKLPEYEENIRFKTRLVREAIQEPYERATHTVKDLSTGLASASSENLKPARPEIVRTTEADGSAFQALRNAFGPVVGFTTVLALALLFAVIMLLRPEDLRDRVIRLMGNGRISVTTQALDEASKRVSSYLARQLLMNGALGTCLAIGLLLIGVPNAVLWGLMLVFLRFIPYVGIWIAAAFPIIISLATTSGWSEPLQTVGLFLGLELLCTAVLEPWIYCGGTGISPLAILLSTLFWSWLWGPIGLILATPMTVCLVVLGKYVPQLHFLHLMFSDAPALLPDARLYQRLVAQDHDEAWSILKTEAGKKPLPAVYDAVLLPALSMAEMDRRRGSIDDDSAEEIQEGVQLLVKECQELELCGATQEGESALPKLTHVRALCMPARNAADALAVQMLDHVLQATQAETEIVPLAEFVGETIERFERRPVDVVILSAVPPSRFMHVRYVCKRLARQYPDLEIIVGLWTVDLDDATVRERIPEGPHVQVVTSLKQVLDSLAEIERRNTVRGGVSRGGLANTG